MKKDKYRLILSLIVVICLIVGVFFYLEKLIEKKNSNAINDIGNLYMDGMNEQIAMHYEATIDLRLTMVDTMTNEILNFDSMDEVQYQSVLETLERSGKARGFTYVGFYFSDESVEMIYGDQVVVNGKSLLLESIQKGERKAASARDADGNNVVMFCVPCNLVTPNGNESIALVAGIPADEMSRVLFLSQEMALVNSYVIRDDGSYVLRRTVDEQANYFDRIYDVVDGKKADPEQYIAEMKTAIEKGESFSSVLELGDSRSHVYCSALPYCEWYLVTVLPYNELDAVISDMSTQWLYQAYLCCGVLLVALLLLFFQYFTLLQKQLKKLNKVNTELDSAYNEARKAQKDAEKANKAKSEFLSNMSHDIRTPMNAIVGMTAIAVTNIDNKERVRDCLKKITLSSKHLLGLINDVLDMSKIENGKLTLNRELVSLRETMENIVNIIQPQVKAKHQQFNIFIQEIISENVCCDSVRLNQVLINLLGNAVKFTQEEGAIQVSVSQEPSPKGEKYIRTHFWVKDNGIGMSEEYQQQIFDSFSREDNTRVQKTEGSGLGMAITKYIVDAMEGTIVVESKLGMGSEFHVVLDLEVSDIKEEEMMLPNWNMLVVDDEEELCLSAVSALESIGVHSDWCTDAEKAIRMVEEQYNSQQDNYHIILLDWKMPNMDGIAVARELRHRYGDDIPILLISAYDWSEIEEEARGAGVTGFISKPLFKSTLFYGLREYAGMSEDKEEKTVSNSDNTALKGKHILLAEDNEINWEVAKELLSNLGMELEWAENGRICVEKFQQSDVGYYDAILMDIRMPVMDGYQATQTIRAMERPDAVDIPIFAMTADAFSEDIMKCKECGMNAHLAKPIDVKEICYQLKLHLKKEKE